MKIMKKMGVALLAATMTFASVITSQAGVITRIPENASPGRIAFDVWDSYYRYNGVEMNKVFTAAGYLRYNPDLKEWANSIPSHPGDANGPNLDWEYAIFEHFIKYGTREGRRASSNFDVKCYMAHNPDLVAVFGTEDLLPYYVHFAQYGWDEKRIAVGVYPVEDTYVDLTDPGIEGVHYVMKDGQKYYMLSNCDIYYNTAVGNVYPYQRTDFADGLVDKNHNGLDDRDPLDGKGFYDLNHDSIDDRQITPNGSMNAMQELRLFGQAYSPSTYMMGDSEYVECEHGIIVASWSKKKVPIVCNQCKERQFMKPCEEWKKSKYSINWDQYIAKPKTEDAVTQ